MNEVKSHGKRAKFSSLLNLLDWLLEPKLAAMSLEEVGTPSNSVHTPLVHPIAGSELDARAAKRPRLDAGPSSHQPDIVTPDQEQLFRTAAPAIEHDPPRQAASHANGSEQQGRSEHFPTYDVRYTLTGHKKSVSSVKFSPNGRWIATAC